MYIALTLKNERKKTVVGKTIETVKKLVVATVYPFIWEGHLGYFQFLAIINKAGMNNYGIF